MKAYYEGNPDKFRTEEQRLVSRIALPYTPSNKDEVRKKASEVVVEATKGRAAVRGRREEARPSAGAGRPG